MSKFSSPFMAKSPLNQKEKIKEEVEGFVEGTKGTVYTKQGKRGGRSVAIVENTEDDGSKTYEKATGTTDKDGYIKKRGKRKNISKKRAERIKKRKDKRYT